jgi:probable rRNA maturation factor
MIYFDPELELPSAPAHRDAKLDAAARSAKPPTARTLAKFLALAQDAVRLKGQVAVMFTTDRVIRRLNRQFRGKNKATDVLSFPAAPMPGLKPSEQLVGDLAISVETALKQANGQGHPLRTEIKVLMLHGLLHLAGYDHEADTGQMARRERALRTQLKLPLGLIERVEKPAAKSSAKPAVKKKSARSARA